MAFCARLLDDDLHIVAEKDEKAHEPLDREAGEAATLECGDFRLIHIQLSSSLLLSQPPGFDQKDDAPGRPPWDCRRIVAFEGSLQFMNGRSKAALMCVLAGLCSQFSSVQGQGSAPPAGKGNNPIGVFLRCTGEDDPLRALKAVKSLGLDHIQVSRLPNRFYTPEGAREFAAMLRTTGIQADSVVAVFAGESYRDRESVIRTVGFRPLHLQAERLDYSRKCVDFASAIGARSVTFHMGFLPEDPSDAAYRSMLAAVTEIAAYAAPKKITISLETGQETGDQLAAFLDRITVARVGVNFDAANLVIYGVDSPSRALERLAPRVTSLHVKDALLPENAAVLGREVRLGEGRAELKECFRILRKSGFKGALIIENYISRGLKTDPMDELRRAKEFIEGAGW